MASVKTAKDIKHFPKEPRDIVLAAVARGWVATYARNGSAYVVLHHPTEQTITIRVPRNITGRTRNYRDIEHNIATAEERYPLPYVEVSGQSKTPLRKSVGCDLINRTGCSHVEKVSPKWYEWLEPTGFPTTVFPFYTSHPMSIAIWLASMNFVMDMDDEKHLVIWTPGEADKVTVPFTIGRTCGEVQSLLAPLDTFMAQNVTALEMEEWHTLQKVHRDWDISDFIQSLIRRPGGMAVKRRSKTLDRKPLEVAVSPNTLPRPSTKKQQEVPTPIPVEVVVRKIVSEGPYLARLSGPRDDGGMRYASQAVIERRWDDGTVDYRCAGCDYSSSNHRSVASHYSSMARKADGSHPHCDDPRTAVVQDPEYTEPSYTFERKGYTPKAERLSDLKSALEEVLASGLTGDALAEELALTALTWQHERIGASGNVLPRTELTPEQVLDKILRLADRGQYAAMAATAEQNEAEVTRLREENLALQEEIIDLRKTTEEVQTVMEMLQSVLPNQQAS